MLRLRGFLAAGTLVLVSSSAFAAADAYVVGDSIGDGIAIASGEQNLAHMGVHIRGPKALAQIARAPVGSKVFIFLGTNDAEGSINNIGKSVDDIVAAVTSRRLNAVWVGPHCVKKAWDSRGRELDAFLGSHLAGTGIKYVSMRDSRICSGVFHEPDGVHLTMKGYHYMWDIARNAAGSVSDTRLAAVTPQKTLAGPGPTDTTGSVRDALAQAPQPPRGTADGSSPGRLITEFHVPASPAAPLIWTRSSN
jgi:hypothetical protein